MAGAIRPIQIGDTPISHTKDFLAAIRKEKSGEKSILSSQTYSEIEASVQTYFNSVTSGSPWGQGRLRQAAFDLYKTAYSQVEKGEGMEVGRIKRDSQLKLAAQMPGRKQTIMSTPAVRGATGGRPSILSGGR